MTEEFKTDEAMIRHMEERAAGTFWDYLGCKLHSLEAGKIVISLELKEHHLNPIGIVHGGVLSSMLDNVMGIAAQLTRGAKESMVTTNLNVHFVAPLKSGTIYASAQVIHQSRKSLTVTGTVSDEQGQLGTYGTGSFRVI